MTPAQMLRTARVREKDQTLFYRGLAALAGREGQGDAAERLSGLHADEQHHFSRLTARLLEFGEDPADLRAQPLPDLPALEDWEDVARGREEAEVAYYEEALERELDPDTRAVLVEILVAERQHLKHLGGKWMSAQ